MFERRRPSSHLVAGLLLLAAAAPAVAQAERSARDLPPATRRAILAIKDGDMQALKKELDAGLSPDAVDHLDDPLVTWAFDANQPAMIRELARRGASLDWVNEKGVHLLGLAVILERLEVARALLDGGFDVDRTTGRNPDGAEQGVTALTIAARDGWYDMVRLLVARGANINHVDKLNATPLWRAWHKKHERVARYLESLGATDDVEAARENPIRFPPPAAPPGSAGAPQAAAAPGRPGGETASDLFGATPSAPSGTSPSPSLPPERAPLMPARVVHEIRVATVLGGAGDAPLRGLWPAFQARHPGWGLNATGQRTVLENGTTITPAGRIERLPEAWAAELYEIAKEAGYVPSNPDAEYLVAPRGGTAQVMAEDLAQRRRWQEEGGGAPQDGGAAGREDGPESRGAGRPES